MDNESIHPSQWNSGIFPFLLNMYMCISINTKVLMTENNRGIKTKAATILVTHDYDTI